MAWRATPRLTSFDCRTSMTLLSFCSSSEYSVNNSFLSHSRRETLPLKSKRVEISLLAWATAFSTSWRFSLDTTSKEKSSAIGPFLAQEKDAGDHKYDPSR